MKQKLLVSTLIAAGFVSPLAYATNGMDLAGYGPVSEAMGGASMAFDNGTAAVMNNPATLGLMKDGDRLDLALGLLAPSITAKNGAASADSSATAFYMPAAGYVQKSGQLAYGVGVFSQGGMGTEYGANTFMAAGSGKKVRSEVGVGRFLVPLAYQSGDWTVGGSLDFVWASMDVMMAMPGSGAGSFGDMVAALGGSQTYGTASGSMVNTLAGAFTTPQAACGGVPCLSSMQWARVDFSDNSQFTGAAKGNGTAFNLGTTYRINDQVTIGAAYHSKTSISDLSANSATMSMNVTGPATSNVATTIPVTGTLKVHNFQWPETYGLGVAYKPSDKLMLAFDYKHIGWAAVMKNFSMTFTASASQGNPYASNFGLGGQTADLALFQNWKDQNVFELGGAYKTTDALTLRAGLNLANNPVPDKYMNPLFPAIAQNHVALGAGYAVSPASNIDASFMYVPKVSATNGTGTKVDFGGYSMQAMWTTLF